MALAQKIKSELGQEWIPLVYIGEVRSGRTRAFELDVSEKENDVSIEHTLLGIQLKSPDRSIACPDLSTARYLRVFVRIGCRQVAIPYDITKISAIADELESSWQRTLLLLGKYTGDCSPQVRGRYRAGLVRLLRSEITEAGAGDLMPAFDRETRQRNS